MTLISLKLPTEDLEFQEWYAKKTFYSKTILYRDITLESFRDWKQIYLLNEYMKGNISFKELCKLDNVSFFKAMTLVEESDLGRIIQGIITEYTTELTKKHIKIQDLSIFKNKKPIKRESPFIEFGANEEEEKES